MPTSIAPPTFRGQGISVTLAAHLERLIATGELAPGARLPSERDLAASLRVSRTSLREAMHELEQKNLVERRPGRGTHVVEASDAVRQIHALQPTDGVHDSAAELRALVEPSVAAVAALRATDANLLQLHDVLARTTVQLTPRQSLERDTEFHLLLAHATVNPLVTALHALMTEWTLDQRRDSHATAAGREASLAGHRAILAAVEARDPEAAREAMRVHLEEVRALGPPGEGGPVGTTR